MQVQFNLIVMHEFSNLLFTKKWKSMYKLSLRFSLNSPFFFESVSFSQSCQVVSHHRCVLAPPAAEMVKHMRQHSETSLTGVWHCRLEAAPGPSPVFGASRASAFTSSLLICLSSPPPVWRTQAWWFHVGSLPEIPGQPLPPARDTKHLWGNVRRLHLGDGVDPC